jgi:hypothetical protein
MASDLASGPGTGVSEPVGPTGSPSADSPGPALAGKGWTAGRVIAVVAGSALILLCAVLLGGTGVLTWADQVEQGGYLTTGTGTYSTGGYALVSDPVQVHGLWGWLGRFAGEVRIRVTAVGPSEPVFVAIAPAGDVSRYLAGVSYVSVAALGDHKVTQHPGRAVPAPPAAGLDWAAMAQGTGTQAVRWTVRSGGWTVVVMNADGSPRVAVRADAGVSSPVLSAFAGMLLAGGITAGLIGAALIVVPARMAAGGR